MPIRPVHPPYAFADLSESFPKAASRIRATRTTATNRRGCAARPACPASPDAHGSGMVRGGEGRYPPPASLRGGGSDARLPVRGFDPDPGPAHAEPAGL